MIEEKPKRMKWHRRYSEAFWIEFDPDTQKIHYRSDEGLSDLEISAFMSGADTVKIIAGSKTKKRDNRFTVLYKKEDYYGPPGTADLIEIEEGKVTRTVAYRRKC